MKRHKTDYNTFLISLQNEGYQVIEEIAIINSKKGFANQNLCKAEFGGKF